MQYASHLNWALNLLLALSQLTKHTMQSLVVFYLNPSHEKHAFTQPCAWSETMQNEMMLFQCLHYLTNCFGGKQTISGSVNRRVDFTWRWAFLVDCTGYEWHWTKGCHMMSGKAISRALCGHELVYLALTNILVTDDFLPETSDCEPEDKEQRTHLTIKIRIMTTFQRQELQSAL